MEMQTIGKVLLLFAAVSALAGLLFLLAGRLGLGSLPGTVQMGGRGWSCYLPIVASIVISLVLTLLLNLALRLFR
jgi:phosphotransferase system  glucose/maltose/N-acetylglucosamine-specific IIC component